MAWSDYIEPGSPDPGLLDEDWLRWRLAQLPAEPTPPTTPTMQQLTMPSGFRPAVQTGGGLLGIPRGLMSAEQADAMREGSLDLFSQAALLGGAPAPATAEARALALGRTRTPRSPLPSRMAARITDVPEYTPGAEPYVASGDPYVPAAEGVPVPGVGNNRPPVRSAIWAAPQTRGGAGTAGAGRMGSNADKTLEDLGLPAYGDIVPSTNTGPVSEAQIQAGSPVRPGQVFDLSDTWRVPAVAQEGLLRIDPDAGRRKGLPEHIIQATTDPDMRARLRTVAEAGLNAGGAYWYNAEPLRLAFVSELGPEEGNRTFGQYMRTIGAVSAGSDVGQNIRTASYYNVRERQGNPVQGEQTPKGQWAPTDIESPYGHKMQNTQYGAYRDIAGGEPLDPEMRPKRASFDANLGGNQQPVTVDKHNLRLIGMLSQNPEFLNTTIKADVNYPTIGLKKGDSINFRDAVKSGRLTMDQVLQIPQAWKDVPEADHYAALEGFQQSLAQEMGITPAQLQAALWVGGGRVTGLRSLPTSFMGALENRLSLTAQKRGGTPAAALLDFIRGKKPLLTPLAAGGTAASLLYPEEDQRQ
jgi:hypothetical protein